ncbi:hypothetical protein V1498_17125 [Peribacillus sp. SCS-26]|uniref:hypothetical protein n=1 Tax=Paraperibacillus marinus TaxID=3115295 RepID=UPI003906ADA5
MSAYFGQIFLLDANEVYIKVSEWSEKAARLTIEYEVSLAQSLRILASVRPVIREMFALELEQEAISPLTVIKITEKIDEWIDIVFQTFGEVHEHFRKKSCCLHSA